MMKLSIVIPVYNQQDFLEECIESVLGAKCEDYEIVLVDDGSKDDSLRICREYSKKYENIITISQENQGVSVARNTGIEYARGKYIAFLDADDLVKHTYGIQISEALESNADYILFNFTRWINHEHQQVGNITIQEGLYKELGVLARQVAGLEYCMLSVCSALFKRDIINEFNLRFKKGMRTCEDFLFSIQYIQKIKNMFVSHGAAYCYRDNPNSVTKKRPLVHADDYDYIYRVAKDYLEKCKITDEEQALFQERWIRWSLELVLNWKQQHFQKNEIWRRLECCKFYNENLVNMPQSKKVKLEFWLLKKQYDKGIVIYFNTMKRIRSLVRRK